MRIEQSLEFCAHVGVDFAAQNYFFEHRTGPSHNKSTFKIEIFRSPQHYGYGMALKNHTTPAVGLAGKVAGNHGPNRLFCCLRRFPGQVRLVHKNHAFKRPRWGRIATSQAEKTLRKTARRGGRRHPGGT